MAQKPGSETLGAAGEKGKMTLFKDDRAEDIGAIVISAIVIAYILIVTTGKSPAPPAAAPAAAPAVTAPAAPAAPAPAAPTAPTTK